MPTTLCSCSSEVLHSDKSGSLLGASSRKDPPSSIPNGIYRLGKRTKTRSSRLDIELVVRTLSHRKERPSLLHEGYTELISALESRAAREGEWAESRCAGAGCHKKCAQRRNVSHREAFAGYKTGALAQKICRPRLSKPSQ